jgi:hypothetical protein
MVGEFGDDYLSKQAGSSDAAAQGTRWGLGGDHTITAVRAGILGQNVDMKFKVGRDKLQHTCFILADACLGFSALRAELLGLGYIMLEAHLGQSIVIELARAAWLCGCPGITSGRLGRQDQTLSGFVELEEMPLSGGFHQPFPPWTKDIAAVEIDLPTQLIDRLLVFLDGLIVELRGFFERGLEVLDLLSEPAQQVVTFAGIGGP